MPLTRYAMYAWGAQIYIAATWDRGEQWLASMRRIAREGRVYVLNACTACHRDDVPDRLDLTVCRTPRPLLGEAAGAVATESTIRRAKPCSKRTRRTR